MQILHTLELFVANMLKPLIGLDIAEQIGYRPKRLISLNCTHKVPLKLERGRPPQKTTKMTLSLPNQAIFRHFITVSNCLVI